MVDQLISPTLENEKWEITLSTREKFILNGLENQELDRVTAAGAYKLLKFKDFTINVAHIVSIVCTDRGGKARAPAILPEISDGERERNIRKLSEIRSKLFNKEDKDSI